MSRHGVTQAIAVCASLVCLVLPPGVARPSGDETYFIGEESTIPLTVTGIQDARPLDMDANGIVDVVVTQMDFPRYALQSPILFRNNGSARFTATQAPFVGSPAVEHPRHLVIADFNGDAKDDVFIADHGVDFDPFNGGQSRLFIQYPGVGLVDETSTRLPLIRAFSHNASAGDIDNDGDKDLYISNVWGSGRIGPRVYLNDGTGRFTADPSRIPSPIRDLEHGHIHTACALVDIDRDSDLDLVLGVTDKQDRNRDTLLLNDGRGYFQHAADTSMPVRSVPPDWATVSITAADVNADGWPDLLTTTYSPQYTETKVELLLNEAAERRSLVPEFRSLFGVHDQIRVFSNGSDRIAQSWSGRLPGRLFWAAWVFPADFNNDRWVDFAVEVDGSYPRLFMNQGGGRFVDATSILPTSRTGVRDARGVTVGDFDRDGDIDLFAIYHRTLMVARNRRPYPAAKLCAYTLNPGDVVAEAGLQNLALSISTSTSCAWTVRSDSDWLNVVSSATGVGSATANVTIAPNAESTIRVGTLSVGDYTILVRQRPALPIFAPPSSAPWP